MVAAPCQAIYPPSVSKAITAQQERIIADEKVTKVGENALVKYKDSRGKSKSGYIPIEVLAEFQAYLVRSVVAMGSSLPCWAYSWLLWGMHSP